MITTLLRLLTGAVGLLLLTMAAGAVLDPGRLAGQLGLAAAGPLGVGTLRGDLGGFFLVSGGFALVAAIRGDRRWLLAPLALIGCALLGRLATMAQLGASAEHVRLAVGEGVIALVFAAARQAFPFKR